MYCIGFIQEFINIKNANWTKVLPQGFLLLQLFLDLEASIEGIYNRLALTKCYLLDIDLALYTEMKKYLDGQQKFIGYCQFKQNLLDYRKFDNDIN